MNQKLNEALDLFVTGSQIMKKGFTAHDTSVKRLAALLYAFENKTADREAIRECLDLIKQKTGAFSTFRGNMAVCIATLLSLSENRDTLLTDTLFVYDLLKQSKFKASDYLVIASYEIASVTDTLQHRHVVERTKAFYDGMKAHHWFHTGSDDYIFAAMLGLSDIDVNAGVDRMEAFYPQLKRDFRAGGNTLQTLSQVLVLSDQTDGMDGIITRILALRDALQRKKINPDKEHTLPSLGILSLLPVDTETIAEDVSGACEFLRTQKGFGSLSVSKQELLLYSMALTAFVHMNERKSDMLTSTLSTGITNILIAQQTAMIAAIAASSAAASAAASSSSCT